MLTQSKVSARLTERTVQELLYAWVSKYFTGAPHLSKLGDVTFPLCDVLFNQTQIDDPSSRPQLHFVFTDFRPHETWFANGNLSVWKKLLANPSSGVSYGLTQVGTIQESIHGKLARTIAGTNLRWTVMDDGLHEQAFDAGVWRDERVFAGAIGLRWVRSGGNYVEEARVDVAWIPQRTITVNDPMWDGTKKLVVIDAMITLFIRTMTAGENSEAPDFLCRSVADNFHELLQDETARAELTQKGFRRLTLAGGPTPMATSGMQTRALILSAVLRYFLPREQ